MGLFIAYIVALWQIDTYHANYNLEKLKNFSLEDYDKIVRDSLPIKTTVNRYSLNTDETERLLPISP